MVFVNAYNVNKGGGVNVILNYITYLLEEEDYLIVALPRIDAYKKLVESNPKIKAYWFGSSFWRFITKFYVQNYLLNQIVKKNKIEKVYSLGNLAFRTNVPQALLIQNAFSILNDQSVWKRMTIIERLYLKAMKFTILNNSIHASVILVQTNFIKNELSKDKRISKKRILIYPNVVNVLSLRGSSIPDAFKLDQQGPLNLLFLSKYYPHKNFEILLDLSKRLLDENINVHITVTLDSQDSKELKIIKSLQKFPEIITNIGVVNYSSLKEVYSRHHGIFLPTLLESFSSTYIEAMYFNRLILTSNREFAKEICGKAAYYFNPNSVDDIIMVFKEVLSNSKLNMEKLKLYESRITELSGNNFKQVNQILYRSI